MLSIKYCCDTKTKPLKIRVILLIDNLMFFTQKGTNKTPVKISKVQETENCAKLNLM